MLENELSEYEDARLSTATFDTASRVLALGIYCINMPCLAIMTAEK